MDCRNGKSDLELCGQDVPRSIRCMSGENLHHKVKVYVKFYVATR